jgi:hypothetical protein
MFKKKKKKKKNHSEYRKILKIKNLYLRNTFYTHIYLAWWVELIEG